VQKLSGAVFCTAGTAEKLTVLDQTNGESVLNHNGISIKNGMGTNPVKNLTACIKITCHNPLLCQL